MPTREIQRSFSGGELSPLMANRTDLDIYRHCLSLATNVFPTPHGPAIGRSGFEYIVELPGEDYARLFEFDIDFDRSFVVAVTRNKIYVIDSDSIPGAATPIADSVGIELLQNAKFVDDSVWLQNNSLFIPGSAYLQTEDFVGAPIAGDAWVRQEVTGLNAAGTFQVLIRGITNGVGVPNQYSRGEYILKVGTAAGLDDIYSETINATIEDFAKVDLTPGAASFWIEVFCLSGATDPSNNVFLDEFSLREITSGSTASVVEFVSPYNDNDIKELQIDMVPGKDTMYLFTRDVKPQQLSFINLEGGSNIWSFDEISFTFGVGSTPWNDEYPGTITFHEGRMWLGGIRSKPITLWASKPFQYTNFDFNLAGDPVLDDDALEFTLDKHGEIQWILSNKELFIGLDTGEHVLTSEAGVITPSDIQSSQQSSYGSTRIQSDLIDEQTLYVDTQARAVRLMDFVRNQNSWASVDLSYQAEHITFSGITEIEYGTSPIGLIWAPLSNGQLLTCATERDRGTLGWSRHVTQGSVISVAVLKEQGVDIPWISVLRNINGEDKLYIERYQVVDQVFMDSYKTVTELVETFTFTGFDHLEGETVQVVADGANRASIVVVGGEIILDQEFGPAFVVEAGLQYIPVLHTLPEQKDIYQDNSLNHTKRYSEIYVAILDSHMPYINDEDTFKRQPETPMNEPRPRQSALIEVKNLGWSKVEFIKVSQPLPLSFRIIGIGGSLQENIT